MLQRPFYGRFYRAASSAPPIAVVVGGLGWAGVVTTRPHHVGHAPWVRVVTTPACLGAGCRSGARSSRSAVADQTTESEAAGRASA